jgi:hypothetical protein
MFSVLASDKHSLQVVSNHLDRKTGTQLLFLLVLTVCSALISCTGCPRTGLLPLILMVLVLKKLLMKGLFQSAYGFRYEQTKNKGKIAKSLNRLPGEF